LTGDERTCSHGRVNGRTTRRLAGEITPAQLKAIEDAEIAKLVARQEEIGLQGVTDGEFRRVDWLMDFKFGIGGVEQVDAAAVKVPFRNESGGVDWSFVPYRIGARLHHNGTIFGDDFTFLRSAAKVCTRMSPTWFTCSACRPPATSPARPSTSTAA